MRVKKELDKEALINNINVVKKIIDNNETKIMAVVKSDAYGNGMYDVVDAIDEYVNMYAVANIDEGIKLRTYLNKNVNNGENKNKIEKEKEILIIGYFDEERVNELYEFNIIQGISNFNSLDIIEKQDKKIKVHIKVNTGMNRLGFDIDNHFFEKIKQYTNIIIDGIYSHIAYSDNVMVQKEIEKSFDEVIEKFNSNNIYLSKKHLLNSAGLFNKELKRYDFVRPGIILYGYYPSNELKEKYSNSDYQLKECISIKTKIINVRNIKKGDKISYEGTYEAPNDRIIATIPIGYADGYLRSNSNCARVFVNGKYANVVGRICMNLTMIDITDVDASIGDEVIILGKEVTADELAKISQTIPYEILTNFKFE